MNGSSRKSRSGSWRNAAASMSFWRVPFERSRQIVPRVSSRSKNVIHRAIDRWITFFDLDETRGTICRDLSKGTRQKLMLAAAFLHDPDLLFLDEPFINLDPIYQRRLKDFLLEYHAAGHTVFMCSHLLEIAEKLCNQVAIIDGGRLIARGSVAELRKGDKDLEAAFLRLVGERR